MTRRRLDTELMRRDLVSTRSRARELIRAGQVLVGGAIAVKPTRMVAPGDPVVVSRSRRKFVSRGGEKLDAALNSFQIEITGKRVVDVGASTGGFSDCVLQRGAREVVAIDVGYGQLDQGIRTHPRVQVFERTNVRYIEAADVGGSGDLVVADLSFISLRTVLPSLVDLCGNGGDLLMLVKPQFEAVRAETSRGQGIIRSPDVWLQVLEKVSGCVSDSGFGIMGVMPSPLRGAGGNTEFFMYSRAGAADAVQVAAAITKAITDAKGEATS
ncbi:MAG TPA: TlyA family RNA methyltransferase [Acidimicrobiales bacterium]|nr:TlyA family RNA methyltransferase [Acidimicrobiales bacterium]